MPSRDAREASSRAAARRAWPVRLVALGAEAHASLDRSTSPEERLAMVWTLTVEAWALSGRPMPAYSRATTPVQLGRPDGRRPEARDPRVNQDFQDMLAALLSRGARFLVVGAPTRSRSTECRGQPGTSTCGCSPIR
jgi:hypothetical protein